MAGGSFGNFGSPGPAMSQSLFAQMDQMRRTSVGVQDIWTNQMYGASPYGAGGQAMGMAGDAMMRLNQSLDQLNQRFQSSPLLSGRGAFGGAGFSGGQMIAAGMFGAPVQVQGLPMGASAPLGRMMMAENMEIAMEGLGRRAATQLAPGLIGAAASMLPGGFILGPMAGAAAQMMAPSVLRSLGWDAALEHGAIARNFRQSIGDRMAGGSVVGRFTESFAAGQKLASGMTDYISNQQQNYQSGIVNFGLSAEEYAPLQQAMMSTMNQRDLNRLVEGGAAVIKEQMDALLSVSGTLNMTFEETAQLAAQFGEVEGGATALANYVNTIETAAQRAGGGVTRGLATRFGLAMRAQGRQLGLQGGLTADQAVQDVGVLQLMMNQSASSRLVSMDQLASFGGNTEQEQIQNAVAAMFGAGSQISQGPMGAMIRGNLLAGRGAGAAFGSTLGMMATAGGQFARDPFGFVISQADPRVNQQVQSTALFGYINQLEQMGMGVSSRFGHAAFIAQAERMGLSKTQAGAIFNMYKTNQAQMSVIGEKAGGRSAADIMGVAASYAAQAGISVSEAMAMLSSGQTTVAAMEMGGQGVFGSDRTQGFAIYSSDADIEREAKAAGEAARTIALAAPDVAAEKNMIRLEKNGNIIGALGGELYEGIRGFARHHMGIGVDTIAGEQAYQQAYGERLRSLQAARASSNTSMRESQYLSAFRNRLTKLGVEYDAGGGANFSKFTGGGLVSEEFAGLVRAVASGKGVEGAVNTLRDSTDASGYSSLLTTISALSAGMSDKDLAQLSTEFGLGDALNDRKFTETEAKKVDQLGALVARMTQNRGASSLALNALRPMFSEASLVTTALTDQTDILRQIRDNTANAKTG